MVPEDVVVGRKRSCWVRALGEDLEALRGLKTFTKPLTAVRKIDLDLLKALEVLKTLETFLGVDLISIIITKY